MMFEDLSKEHEELKEKVKALKMSQNMYICFFYSFFNPTNKINLS